jgi:hypothetical protein
VVKGHTLITKVLAKQKEYNKSTATIAIEKQIVAIDSRRQIDPRARVPGPGRQQVVGMHEDSLN